MSTANVEPSVEDVTVMVSDALGAIYGWDLSQDGSTVKIGIGPYSDDDKLLVPEVHFRAVVVEGDQTPIVANRPDLTNPGTLQGPHLDEDGAERLGWHAFATNHVIFGGSGHISFAEARRFGAALIALADAHDLDVSALSDTKRESNHV
ncbi:MAG: hypothetical protein ABR585_07375 [Gemmatimonadaceae bacterium]